MGSNQVSIVLNNLKYLSDLLNGYKFSFLPREQNIKLKFDEIDESQKSLWQNKLQQYCFACGYKERSMTSIIFLQSTGFKYLFLKV